MAFSQKDGRHGISIAITIEARIVTIYCLRPPVTNQLAVLYPVAHLTTSAPKGGTVYELIGRVPDVTMTSRLASNTSFPPSFLWSPRAAPKVHTSRLSVL